jgi:hypothetical protein
MYECPTFALTRVARQTGFLSSVFELQGYSRDPKVRGIGDAASRGVKAICTPKKLGSKYGEQSIRHPRSTVSRENDS